MKSKTIFSACAYPARTVHAAALTAFLIVAAGSAQAQQEARIAAVVNDEVISQVDLMDRTRLVVFASGLPLSDEFLQRLMPQVLNNLINEALQRQEAAAQNIRVRDREIETRLTGMEQRNNLPPGGLDEFLISKGIAKSALLGQIRSSLAWAKLVERRLSPQVDIGDEEIDETIRSIMENQGKPQHLVSEIFLAVDDPATENRIRDSAMRIGQQLREGIRFDALARAFSQNAAAASGGDLGWLREGQMDEAIDKALSTMQPGQVAGPVRTPDGYHILLLRDRRLPGASGAGQTVVDLLQVGLPLPPSATEDERRVALGFAEDIRARATDCTVLEDGQLPGNAKSVRLGRMKIADLAPALQTPIMGLDENQISRPIRAAAGLLMFMVCEREAAAETLPDREAIRGQLELQKLNLLARRYLRDLRRAAFLDIRS